METKIFGTPLDLKRTTGFDVHTNGQEIYWTKNYDLFNFIEGNRSRDDETEHIRKIKNSILKYGWFSWSHIIVRDKMKVCDGQNRLWALKEIKEETGKVFEIGYEVDRTMNLEKIQAINNCTKTWGCKNYINSNIALGKTDYVFIRNLMKEYKLSYTTALILILKYVPGRVDTDKFQRGLIVVKNPTECLQFAKWIYSIKPYFKNYSSRNFVSAMVFYFCHPEFVMDEFIQKLAINREMLYPVTTISGYKKLIQDIYNYRRREKITFIQA